MDKVVRNRRFGKEFTEIVCDHRLSWTAMIRYICARCKTKLETDDDLGMQKEDCPVCSYVNSVPMSKQQLKEEKRKQKEFEAKKLSDQAAALQRDRERKELAERQKKDAQKKAYEAALSSIKKESLVVKLWYCFVEGKEWGPMPEVRLQAWISEGRVKPADKIRPEGIEMYVKLSDLPEIFTFSKANDCERVDTPCCPRCGSTHISANKKGVDAANACCGAILLGPLGLLCGLTDKVVVTCLKCGHQWKMG